MKKYIFPVLLFALVLASCEFLAPQADAPVSDNGAAAAPVGNETTGGVYAFAVGALWEGKNPAAAEASSSTIFTEFPTNISSFEYKVTNTSGV